MNGSCQTPPGAPASSKAMSNLVEGFFKAVWVVPAVAVLAAVLLLVIGHDEISAAGRKFIASLIYSAMIGLPSAVLLTWSAYRYSERFPRLLMVGHMSPP